MNSLATIEPEILELLPARTMLKIIEQAQKAKKWSALFQSTVTAHAELFRILEELDIDCTFNISDGDIHMCFTGDGARLGTVWGHLRRNGYKTTSHPKKGESTFYAYWEKAGFARFWMNFSSSVCRRVQIGTKMVQQPIYEVQCGDIPELEAAGPALTVIDGGIDDVPF